MVQVQRPYKKILVIVTIIIIIGIVICVAVVVPTKPLESNIFPENKTECAGKAKKAGKKLF